MRRHTCCCTESAGPAAVLAEREAEVARASREVGLVALAARAAATAGSFGSNCGNGRLARIRRGCPPAYVCEVALRVGKPRENFEVYT